ncbi:hypothetical protein QO259_16860 [Salinicola sp. JS01]|uniref:hypothetical protein n=1 Tax=Salinicola sp. JS01 TaxID=3050071 RepID=UPI00255BBA55|nr:hypothetical protein [Salinicola sp. JS01]WIX32459.1 hypothetical protein QO259_16860 [Salinicola sp. JS01]
MPRSTSAARWLKKTHAETHSDIEGSNVSTISQGQEFYAKTQARLMLGVGGVALALGLFMAVSFTTAPVAPIGMGGLMVGMACWFHFSPVARIGADYLVFQPAPLARTRTILDSEVERIERKKKVLLVHYRYHDDKLEKSSRKMAFAMNMLTAEDREMLLEILAARFEITQIL